MENINKGIERFLKSQNANTSGNGTEPDDHDDGYNGGDGPDCEICDNLRWVARDDGRDARDFGKLAPCECQEIAWGVNRARRLKDYSLLSDPQFVSFVRDTLPDGALETLDKQSFRAAFDAAREFADNPSGWLVIEGPINSGKTHLARAAIDHCVKNDIPARFEKCATMLDELRELTANADERAVAERLEQAMQVDVLILDDLGGAYSNWGAQQLSRIIEHRYDNRLPTLITTDHNLDQIDADASPLLARLANNNQIARIRIQREPAKNQLALGVSAAMLKIHTFNKFKSNYKSALTASSRKFLNYAKESALKFAQESPPQKWLYIGGAYGTGKTHLALAIVNELRKRDAEVAFRFVPDLLEELRGAYDERHHRSYYNIFKQLKNTPCLILDDLGSELVTAWSAEKLYQLIVYRYDNLLPTVITSRGLLKTVRGVFYSVTLEDLYAQQTAQSAAKEHDAGLTKEQLDYYLKAIMTRLYDAKRVEMVAIDHEENLPD